MDIPAVPCNKCQRTDAGPMIPFWDGQSYCEACLEAAMPGLAQYAREHRALEERYPYSWRRALKRWSVLMAAPLVAQVVAYGIRNVRFRADWPFSLPTTILISVGYWGGMALVVSVTGGRPPLIVRFAGGELVVQKEKTERYPLSRLRSWCQHRKWVGMGAPSLRGEVIRIGVPPESITPLTSEKAPVTCGWSPEMRQRWQAALTLAGISEDPNERWRRRSFRLPRKTE